MARTFTVDNVTFTINVEATFTDENDFNRAEISDELIWPTSNNTVQALSVCCGQFVPQATMTATLVNGGTTTELERWVAGFTQTIVRFDRNAHYVDRAQNEVAQIAFLLQHGIPIHDGEPGSFPQTGTYFEDGQLVVVESGEAVDDPYVQVPTDLNTNPAHAIDATLRSVSGTDTFVTWLAIYRMAADPIVNLSDRACYVPLTKVEWSSNYHSELIVASPPQFSLPAHLEIGVPELLAITPRYTRQPMGVDGRNFPDTREDASANTMKYGRLTGPDGYELRWSFDEVE